MEARHYRQTNGQPQPITTHYAYDYNGNLISKTDALGVITCFGPVTGTQCGAKGIA